jgi:hypothetical protein
MMRDEKHDHKLTIIFVVNGQDVPTEMPVKAPLKAARDKALEKSQNTGRPFDEWEIRTEAGIVLSPDEKIETFNFKDGVRLYLTLRVGAGG